MELITVHNLSKKYADKQLFENISFSINQGNKIGLIGKNGTGKTTLFNILTNLDLPDNGQIYKNKNLSLFYLKQKIDIINNHFILDPTNYQENISDLYKYAKQLNLNETCFYKQTNELSGGEILKLQLINMFLSSSNLLLLDEPTNHLDLVGVTHLINWLNKEYLGAYIITSHNRNFLNNVTTRIFELNQNKIKDYNCGFQEYLIQKQKNLDKEWSDYNKSQKETTRLKKSIQTKKQWIEDINIKTGQIKQGIKNDTLRQKLGRMNQSQKKIADYTSQLSERIFQINTNQPYTDTDKINIHFFNIAKGNKEILNVRNINLDFNTKTLFKDITLDIYRGDKLILLGDNGVGKTTLLRLIINELKPKSGTITLGDKTKIGYLKQNYNYNYDNHSIIEYLSKKHKQFDSNTLRIYLAKFLFRNDQVNKKLNMLSGGEIIKLQLLECLIDNCNFLILDEPTNNLDLESIKNLESALKDFEGTLLIVTHDIEFIKNVATRIIKISNNKLEDININNL